MTMQKSERSTSLTIMSAISHSMVTLGLTAAVAFLSASMFEMQDARYLVVIVPALIAILLSMSQLRFMPYAVCAAVLANLVLFFVIYQDLDPTTPLGRTTLVAFMIVTVCYFPAYSVSVLQAPRPDAGVQDPSTCSPRERSQPYS